MKENGTTKLVVFPQPLRKVQSYFAIESMESASIVKPHNVSICDHEASKSVMEFNDKLDNSM